MSGCSGDPGQPTLGKFPGKTIAAGHLDLLLLVEYLYLIINYTVLFQNKEEYVLRTESIFVMFSFPWNAKAVCDLW